MNNLNIINLTMPKIFVDDFSNGVSNSSPIVDIYPVDYDYCADYIVSNIKTNGYKYSCYTCNDEISYMRDTSDFEMTVLSCGHLHHTACLLSKTVNKRKHKNDNKCKFCSSNDRIEVIKNSLEKTYYACILAYDMKNSDYISTFSDFSQKCKTMSNDQRKKKQPENETMNIKIEIKGMETDEKSKPTLRRSARLIEKNKMI